MNRRTLLKSLTAASTLALVPVTGCAFSVEGTINVIIQAIGGILSYVGGAAPWVAQLQAALAALQQAMTTWKAGGAVAILLDALNTVEAVLAVIPLTAIYSPLIDLIVSGIEAIINYFNPQAAVTAKAVQNPHRGRVTLAKPHAFQSQVGAWREQYNDAAVGLGLVQLKVA